MKIIIIIFIKFIFISMPVLSSEKIPNVNSKLPPCNNKQTEYRDNCFGTYVYEENTKWRGDKYIGEFRNGRFNGNGKWIYGPHSPYAGSYYIGEFKDDELHGHGVFIEANGNKYIGQFQNDLYNGKGTQTWSNGDKYIGQWKDDLKHGLGIYIWSNEEKYSGSWYQDKRNGEGKFFYKNGDSFVGWWKNNLKHGYGTFYYANGKKFSGTWKDDILLFREHSKSSSKLTNNKFIKNGRFFALLFANYKYKYMNNLITPEKDIDELQKVLNSRYGFQTHVIKNANEESMITEITKFNNKISSNDHLLIYYAGHGHLDENEGFWLPTDARLNNESKWLSNAFIIRQLKKNKAKNILLMADSCFSGTLTRGISKGKNNDNYDAIDLYLKTKSRIAISSGGLKPVLDGGGGGHSIFARMFLNALKANSNPMTSFDLFSIISKRITEQAMIYNIEQTPEIGTIERAGHVGRDFVFIPKK